jgi:hypothetical protein
VSFLAEMLGGLIPTFLLSRLLRYILRGRPWPEHRRIVVAHAVSLAMSWTLVALGDADGGAWQWGSGWHYVLPQVVWYIIDRRKLRALRQRETV